MRIQRVSDDPRAGAGRKADFGEVVAYVSAGGDAALLLAKHAGGDTDWRTLAPPGGGASLADGDYGDVVVSGGGAAMNLDAGVVSTAKLGGDITTAGKALLDDADAAAQRTTLGAAAASHTHAQADVTNLVSDLAGKAAASHSHAQADVTNLVSDLAGKAAASHNHNASDINAGTVATARLGSGTADSTKFLRGDQTWAAPGGGSDPWTHVVLGSDFTTTLATPQAVTGLNFTPAASKRYIVEGFFLLRTATATVGPRPGVSWPTGVSDSAARIEAASSATASIMANGNHNAALQALSTGVPNTTQSWPGNLWATVVTGASPSGNLQITLQSETGGTTVTMKAGSWIRYREI